MLEAINMSLWQGRTDKGPVAQQRRWHQLIKPLTATLQDPGIALLGFACDEGVRRNQGRVGAAAGADAIRRSLANQVLHSDGPVYEVGNLRCESDGLQSLQLEQSRLVKRLLDLGHFPLLLGGGHEIAFGSYLGLVQHLGENYAEGPVGIINFDAHFDLREAVKPTSGTPFSQMADSCRASGREFNYFCLGISETANTPELFARAEKLGVRYLLDSEVNSWQFSQVEQQLADFIAPCCALYLSIDLDVLPASVAPGVSAPAGRGMPLAELEHLLTFIRTHAKKRLRVADIAEYNPDFDIDSRTAKVAARLCHQLVQPSL